jgi:hypothetical protein
MRLIGREGIEMGGDGYRVRSIELERCESMYAMLD